MRDTKETVNIIFEDLPMRVPAGISVAAAVLGHTHPECLNRHPVDGSARSPFCLMGVCFECLMEINGVPNVQSCMVPVAEGMVVKRQLNTTGENDAKKC